MKLSQLIKELQDNIFDGQDPEVVIEYKLNLYPIAFTGDYDGSVVIYTRQTEVNHETISKISL